MEGDRERTFVVDLADVETAVRDFHLGHYTGPRLRGLGSGGAFRLIATETNRGLPLKLYLDRVHPEDRPYLAKEIAATMVGGRAQQSTYRVRTRGGHYVSVVAFGRCFRDRKDTPVLYSGIVVLESATSASDHRRH